MTDRRAPLTDEEQAARTVGERLPLNGPIVLAAPDPEWPRQYGSVEAEVRAALGEQVLQIDHVGSTSVPRLMAKPIIDVQLVVADSADESAYVPALEAVGYAMRKREPDWFEHRLLRRFSPEVHLHVFSAGCPEISRVLAFRDQLRRSDADRRLYEETKQALAVRVWRDRQHYADAKSPVIDDILSRARTAADANPLATMRGAGEFRTVGRRPVLTKGRRCD